MHSHLLRISMSFFSAIYCISLIALPFKASSEEMQEKKDFNGIRITLFSDGLWRKESYHTLRNMDHPSLHNEDYELQKGEYTLYQCAKTPDGPFNKVAIIGILDDEGDKGKRTYFDKDGNPREETTFLRGKGTLKANKSGERRFNCIKFMRCMDGEWYKELFMADNIPPAPNLIEDGKLRRYNGYYECSHGSKTPDGPFDKVAIKGNYDEENKAHGKFTYYDMNANLIKEEVYVYGHLEGTSKEWDSNGNLTRTVKYYYNPEEETIFDADGKILVKRIWRGSNNPEEEIINGVYTYRYGIRISDNPFEKIQAHTAEIEKWNNYCQKTVDDFKAFQKSYSFEKLKTINSATADEAVWQEIYRQIAEMQKIFLVKSKTTIESLKEKKPHIELLVKTGDELNPNDYFKILNNLSMAKGFILDYYLRLGRGNSSPDLYSRSIEAVPLVEFAYWIDGQQTLKPNDSYYSDFNVKVIPDGTPESYFQKAVLSILGEQFYLRWHGCYNDSEIICNKERLQSKQPYLKDQADNIMKIDPTPMIKFEGDKAEVWLLTFTEWAGLVRCKYVFNKNDPSLSNISKELLIPYNSGICF